MRVSWNDRSLAAGPAFVCALAYPHSTGCKRLVCRVAGTAVDGIGRAELPADRQAVVVEVDHDDLRRRAELRGQQCGQADGAGADDRDARVGVRDAHDSACVRS